MKDLAAHVRPPVPNPAPLGMVAFGLTTALFMIKLSRIGGKEEDHMKGVHMLTMGLTLFFGGVFQVLLFLLTTTLDGLTSCAKNESAETVAGHIGKVAAVNALWLAFVELFNDTFGEGSDVIPLGHWTSNSFRNIGEAHSAGRIHGHWPIYANIPITTHNQNEEENQGNLVAHGVEKCP